MATFSTENVEDAADLLLAIPVNERNAAFLRVVRLVGLSAASSYVQQDFRIAIDQELARRFPSYFLSRFYHRLNTPHACGHTHLHTSRLLM